MNIQTILLIVALVLACVSYIYPTLQVALILTIVVILFDKLK